MNTLSSRQPEASRDTGPPPAFRLGTVEVRPHSGRISGPGGERQLDPKVMEVLVRLAASAEQVVSRESLMADVWKDVIVTDFALSRCIYELRKGLKEVADCGSQPIETLPKRGYRLLWPVNAPAGKTPGLLVGRQRLRLAAAVFTALLLGLAGWAISARHGGGGPPPPGEVRLVVLPVQDLSEDRSQTIFSAGLTHEIIHELASIPGLVIVGRTSSMRTDFKQQSPFDYAARLKAEYLLEGGVTGVGQHRRVLLALHKVNGEEQLWDHSFFVEADAPFTMLRTVALELTGLLQVSVDSAGVSGPTTSLEAFEAYLAAWQAPTRDAGRALLNRAVQIDPNFAQAWNELAGMEVMPVWNGNADVNDAWQRARPYLERALAIDPNLSGAYVTLGRFKREFGEFDEAIALFRKALELEPGSTWASGNLGLVLRRAGRFREALDVHAMDVALDPLNPAAQARLGTSNWFTENNEEAERRYRLAADIDPTYEETYDSWSGMLAMGRGQFGQALEMIQKKMSVEGHPTPRTLGFATEWANVLGLENLANEYWQTAVPAATTQRFGNASRAFNYLSRGLDQRARDIAQEVIAEEPGEPLAQLVLAILDIEAGQTVQFLQRITTAYPKIASAAERSQAPNYEAMVMLALAYTVDGQTDLASPLLQQVVDGLSDPLSRQHLTLASAHAIRGETDLAMQQLRASPPGWVRYHARSLLRDPRFSTLRDLPEFRQLVSDHLQALEQQRIAYLGRHRESVASR